MVDRISGMLFGVLMALSLVGELLPYRVMAEDSAEVSVQASEGVKEADEVPAATEKVIYKCKDAQGRVTYREKPCDGDGAALNDLPALNALPTVVEQPAVTVTTGHVDTQSVNDKQKSERKAGSFHCDGRQYCSQMTSCEEAKYFLKNCPDVKMDGGNHDGIPCEGQWCGEE